MESEILIKVEHVSKKFSKDFKRSLYYGILDILTDLLGIRKKRKLRKEEFWAVRDISFELKRGQCLGLIGHNGAGKSTLLKMLNGLIKPDEGTITMRGRVGALIELGAGFNPVLTGRENVFNYGTVLGFSHQEILNRYNDIVDFAEMREFMETPVQNYSSGMKVRLGFAVAAQMEPDVLIIDEVLAVGDVKYKLKCFNRIDEMLAKSAVVFVSHSMPQIARLSQSIMLMNHGVSTYLGDDINEGVSQYYKLQETEMDEQTESDGVILTSYSVNVSDEVSITVSFDFGVVRADQFAYRIQVYNQEVRPVALVSGDKNLQANQSKITFSTSFDNLFAGGRYFVGVTLIRISDGQLEPKPFAKFKNAFSFHVHDKPHAGRFDILLEGKTNEIG